ncbi:DnaB-like helicase C-terminal domain-containing protein [Bryobacter aggregatus]|uniref:DnaB-like helicase C-terminal domain-containing protein n=1 Tax=Bryobacter aggregatus TaxID=360054 RepID=UPI0012BA71AE|nr:DnaB-like helicase C-terminal domain-containing protein [Bryobacter aggregatus]
MPAYHLEDEFQNPQLESLALRFLVEGNRSAVEPFALNQFVRYESIFEAIEGLLLARKPLDGVAGLKEAIDASAGISGETIESVAAELSRLAQLRFLARFQEMAASQLFGGEKDPARILAALETGLNNVRRVMAPEGEGAVSAASLAVEVTRNAIRRFEERKRTGKSIQGVPSGLGKFDSLLNGFAPGLHVLAAGPGAGKTTLCLQWAIHAAENGHPVLYVSYENSPANLTLKLLASRSQQSPTQIERGFANIEALESAGAALSVALRRLHLLEGTRRTTLASIQQTVFGLMDQGDGVPLVIFDYLQRAAHGLGYEQLRHNVSAMSAEMREMANRLVCPLIAISSQNRSQGEYGRGGKPSLDSLKESGDLEYGADSVLVLHPRESSLASAEARPMELSILKNRFGPLGKVNLIFRADHGIFREEA